MVNGQEVKVTESLMGVPVRVNGSTNPSENYIIEVLTRPSRANEGAGVTIKHLMKKAEADWVRGISPVDAVTNQAQRAIDICASPKNNCYILDQMAQSMTDQGLSQTQKLERVAERMIERITIPQEELYISNR